ncbi:MAG: tetratricopeptide repeat protein, partial [Candidatus Delongbacteria bacterium]|nr:tetratricopeptide repeat protein [Candidatus Delongbacteria bacterium]
MTIRLPYWIRMNTKALIYLILIVFTLLTITRSDDLPSNQASVKRWINRVLKEAEQNSQVHPDSIIHDTRSALDSANHYRLQPEINLLLTQLGNCYFYSNRYSLALHHYYQLLENQRANRDDPGQCRTFNRIGRTYGYSNNHEKAMQSYYEAIKLAERIPDRQAYAVAINGLGISYYILGDLNRARELCTQALSIFSELSDDYGKANAMEHLGIIAYRINDYDQARDYYQTALDIKTKLYPHYLLEISELMDELAAVYIKQKQFTKALELLNQLLDYRQRTHNTNREANLYFRIANLHIEMEQIDQAMPYLTRAYQMYRQYGNLRALYNVSLKLYQIYKNHYHDHHKTIRYLEEYSSLKTPINN